MKVCIAEKPSVAREIARVLGAKIRKDGYFEGNGYAVTWTFGHFCTLKTPDDYDPHWKKWDLNTLPILPDKFETKLISNKGVKKQFGIIKKLLKKAQLVINCGDAGQEGELIQRWVLKEAGYKGKVQRLWISSLTNQAITNGFQKLRDARDFDNLFYAGSSRAIGDWLLGINATRLYTLRYGGFKQLLSIGRVQTPTLAMIVARQKEIENFKPEPYWELHTMYREVDFHYEKGRFTKKEDGEKLLAHVSGKPFVILSFTKKRGKEAPPRLFDLTSLQVHCNKSFNYSANQTLQLIQSLYEKKLVTYPRVDTTYLPNDIYPKVAGILKQLSYYSSFTQPLLGKSIRKSAKVFNDKKVTDHHAIIPTGVEMALPANEQNVYDAISRRFIAAFYPDCIVSNNTVLGEVDGVVFKANGKEILEEGWRVLFPKTKKKSASKAKGQEEEKNEEKILPNFVKGERGPHEPTLKEKMTQPPKPYTEATLLRAMETAGKQVDDEQLRELMKANGIGRPSTRANIIETLFKRQYIRRNRKQILATETGVQLIDTVQNELLKSVELTGQWEKKLREIEEGNHSASLFIKEMKTMVSQLVEEVRMEKNVKRISAPVSKKAISNTKKSTKKSTASILKEQPCPKCLLGNILKGNTAFGCSRYKEGCDFRLPFIFMEKKIPEKQILRLFKLGRTINLKGFKQNGQSITGLLRFDKSQNLIFEEKKAKPKLSGSKAKNQNSETDTPICPKCGIGKVIKGKRAYGCSNWQTGCSFRFPFEEVFRIANGKKLTKKLVLEILNSKT